ncbi:MAG: cell division protein FtsZ [Acholeplasmatales bacterium]|jgi:cell division protein FtsZ|nr:cell division protein FtsZ [Acholeplasmatales bacterium]
MANTFSNFEFNATKIAVIGVGGGGENVVERMIYNEVSGIEYIVVNTDVQQLSRSNANIVLQIGKKLCGGKGAGAKPFIGEAAALESKEDLKEVIKGKDLVIITAGMGGGTGSGAAPVVAKISKELGILTVALVTKPFTIEGPIRMENALIAIDKIRPYCDSIIVVPNDRLNELGPDKPVLQMFQEADNVVRKCIQGLFEIINLPGDINLDFNDIKTVLENKGTAHFGIGMAHGDNRAVKASRLALESKLIEESISGATHCILTVSAHRDTFIMSDFYAAIEEVRNVAGEDVNIISGLYMNDDLGEEDLVVTLIAAGYDAKNKNIKKDISLSFREEESNPKEDIFDIKENNEKNTNKTVGSSKGIPDWLKKKVSK